MDRRTGISLATTRASVALTLCREGAFWFFYFGPEREAD
jgi:hypothetical protein